MSIFIQTANELKELTGNHERDPLVAKIVALETGLNWAKQFETNVKPVNIEDICR